MNHIASMIGYFALHIVGFPGLGIDDFEVNPIAIPKGVFFFDIAWYGIIITLGIVFACTYGYLRSKKYKLLFDDFLDLCFGTVLPGVAGARIYYVFFYELENPGTYTGQGFFDNLVKMINFRDGGLAIYGGLIFGALGCLITMYVKKINILKFFDHIAPGVMVAQAMGRWGNFFNAEAYGSETTLPWRMKLTFTSYSIEVHPTFLYESLWNILGFLIIHFFITKKKKFDGQILMLYVSWYGLGRMMIEGLRTDSLMIGSTGIRVSQLLAFICFIVGAGLVIYFTFFSKARMVRVSDCIYVEGSAKYNKAMNIEAPVKAAGEGATKDETENDVKENENDVQNN